MRDKVSGELIIAASTIPGEFLLPPILAKFKHMHPAVRVQVAVSDSLTVINGVMDNVYEVGFSGIAPEGQNLASFKLAGDEIVLIVFPDHPFARRGEVSPAELDGEPLIFREETSGTQRSLEALLSRAGLDLRRWTPHMVLGTTQAVVSAVEARAGIAFVSSLAIAKSLSLGLVRRIGVSGLKLNRDFYCIYRKERIVSRLLTEFLAFIQIEASRSEQGE